MTADDRQRRGRWARVRPLVWGAIVYLVVVVGLTAAGAHPSPTLLAVLFVAGGSLLAFVESRLGEGVDGEWPRAGTSTLGLGRGSDHRSAALARRLANAHSASPDARRHLAAEVHADLVEAVAATTMRSHGLDPRTDRRTLGLLPPDLAEVVGNPPDESLLRPRTLAHLLDRIESL